MPFPIEDKLVVGVASSAVFDMREANEVFLQNGEEGYRKYQQEHLDDPFAKGVAFPFIRRLLNLNRLYPKQKPVEVVVLSKNDPETGRRFFRSCQCYDLDITRGAFVTGRSPHPYIQAFNASLFLSANEEDVKRAVAENLPAGLVLPTDVADDEGETELRVAFDFDGVMADDEAEQVYQTSKSLDLFHQKETQKLAQPHNPGPLKELVTKIAGFQKLEARKAKSTPGYKQALRIAIITARNAPSNERFVTTLTEWGISADETFFLGGIEKSRILEVLKPHIYFDDQLVHLTPASKVVPSVHIPFGVTNSKPLKSVVQDASPSLPKEGCSDTVLT